MHDANEAKGGSAPENDRLISLELREGYLAGAKFEFVPGLNCLIGGRGSGKTTVVELIRYALESPVPEGEERATDSLVRTNLGGGMGRAVVSATTHHGGIYESSRGIGEPARVRGPSGVPVAARLGGELFRADIYAQNQVLAIARSHAGQLALLDGFADDELSVLSSDIEALERELGENAKELTRIEAESESDQKTLIELSAVEESLATLARSLGPSSSGVEEAQRAREQREREKRSLLALRKRLSALASDVETVSASAAVAASLGGDETASLGGRRELETLGLALARMGGLFARWRDEVGEAVAASGRELESATAALLSTYAEDDDAYRELMAGATLGRERALEQERLMKRALVLSDAEERARERRRRHEEARVARHNLLGRLKELRDRRFATRKRVAEEATSALSGELRVTVTAAGGVEMYARLVEELLRGANIRPASLARQIAENIRPEALSDAVEANDLAPIIAVDDSKTGKAERARRVLDTLRAHPRRYDIAAVPVSDVPLIELRVGESYKPSSRVSIGQMCTCILPLLLLQPRGPLIIDQPEDHLDNAFIYDVLVKSIAKVKRQRQLLFVTHNPNIPVLGEADRVFWLTSDGERAKIAGAGTVDEMREPLERLLEGGREAFVRRAARYGMRDV